MIKERMSVLKGSLDLDLLEDALGLNVVRTIGDEDICSCPLPSHNGIDSNPSFSINREKLVYHCFACGIGGNIIDLVARILDVDYDQAFVFCKTYDDKSIDDPFAFGKKLESIFSEKTVPINKPLPRFSDEVIKPWINQPTEYYSKRGINKKSKEKYFLGYDSNHNRGEYSGPCAIIPHFFDNKLVGYQERWIDEDRPKNIPKYTNTRGFPKAETLFGYDQAIGNNFKPVVVVESALTVVYLDQFNYPAVATFGASVSNDQIALLRSFSWGVILSFDNDSAGQQACEMVGDRLRKTIPVHVVSPFGDEKSDLNDLPEEEVARVIESAKPWFLKEL